VYTLRAVTTQILLREEAKTAKKTPSGRWRAILAVPGKGSSGIYTAEVLKEYGPAALPAGMKAYINHDSKRDPRDLLGSYPQGAFWDENEGENGALVSELEPLPSKLAFVEEVAPHVALSIFAMGTVDENGYVTELTPHRTNGVDMVGHGGLEGAGLGDQISESAKALLLGEHRTAAPAGEKEHNVTPEQIAEAINKGLAAALAPVLAFVSEQQAETAARKAEEAAKAADETPSVKEAVAAYALAAKAVADAELSPLQEAAILAVAEEGGDVTKLIEDAKAIKNELATQLTESNTAGGHRLESASDQASYGAGLAW
jgi:hypothetical protein